MAFVTSRIEIKYQAIPIDPGMRDVWVTDQPCGSKVNAPNLASTLLSANGSRQRALKRSGA